MNKRLIVSLCTLSWMPLISGFGIQSAPLSVVTTPNSILLDPSNYKPIFVGPRIRYATCTGAAWFHKNYLASLELFGKKLTTYRFDQKSHTFSLLQEITHEQVPLFYHPEALAISPDNSLLAVVNNDTYNAYLFIFNIDRQTHLIDPTPIFTMKVHGFFHNVRFSPNGKFLACASFDNNYGITIYKIKNKKNSLKLKHLYTHKNHHPLVKTKGINFTRNGKYALIAHGLTTTTSTFNPIQSMLDVYHFDQKRGTLGALVCSVPGTFSFEDLALLHNDQIVALSDQAGDRIVFYAFDPITGQIDPEYTCIQNPEAQLSFPHGVAASPDGNYLVATNYGTDTFNLYRIE